MSDMVWCRLKTQIGLWLGRTFGDAVTARGQLLKLQQEAAEAITALDAGDADGVLKEVADVYVCLLGACTLAGLTERQLQRAVERKLAVLRTRKWVQLPDGTFQHVPAPKGDA